MKMRKVMVAWVVISMIVAVGATAQRPAQASPVPSRGALVPPPPIPWMNDVGNRPMRMGHGVINNCTVRIMGYQNNGNNALACRCYMSPEGATCEVMPRSLLLRADSMREGRMDERMNRRMERRMGGRLPDSMRIHLNNMRVHLDSMRADSVRHKMPSAIQARRGPPPPARRP